MASAQFDETNTSDVESDYDPEVEVVGNWKIVDLPIINIVPPEANYNVLHRFEGKLFRFRNNEWCERGEGEIKFLRHKETKQIVLLMRQRKTFFIRANHFVRKNDILCNLSQSLIHENSWEWKANDISESAPTV